jgi:hypothetical protein
MRYCPVLVWSVPTVPAVIVARVFAPDVRNCSKEFQDVEGVREIVGIVPTGRLRDRANIAIYHRWIIPSLSYCKDFTTIIVGYD